MGLSSVTHEARNRQEPTELSAMLYRESQACEPGAVLEYPVQDHCTSVNIVRMVPTFTRAKMRVSAEDFRDRDTGAFSSQQVRYEDVLVTKAQFSPSAKSLVKPHTSRTDLG
jgi:hypothetical protein